MLWWAWVGNSEAVITLPTIGHKQLTTLDHKPHASKHEDQCVKRTSTSFILRTINQTYVHLNGVHITMTRTLSNTQSYKPSMDMGAMPDNASVIIPSDGLWDMINHHKVAWIV